MAKVCQTCWFENDDQTTYCRRCGQAIQAAPVQPVWGPVGQSGYPAQPAQPAQPVQPAYGQVPYPGQPAAPPGGAYPPGPSFGPTMGGYPPGPPAGPPPNNYPPGYPMGPGGGYGGAPAQEKRGVPLIVKILIPVAAVVLLIGAVVVIGLLNFNSEAQADYYILGNDKIPSVGLVLGPDHEATSINTSTSNGRTTKVINFSLPNTDQSSDMIQYASYLSSNDGFLAVTDRDFSGPEGYGVLGRNSKDAGMQITVAISYDQNGYALTIVKEAGEIIPNDPGEEPSKDPTNTPTSPPTQTNNPYREPVITPAPGWEIVPSADYPFYMKDTAWFMIMTIDLTEHAEPGQTQEIAEVTRNGMASSGTIETVTDLKKTSVAGMDAWEYSYKAAAGQPLITQVFVDNWNWMYEIIYSPSVNDNGQVAAEIQQMLDSFRLG